MERMKEWIHIFFYLSIILISLIIKNLKFDNIYFNNNITYLKLNHNFFDFY